MSVAETHKERTSSDFRDGFLNVVAGQGMIDEPTRLCPFLCVDLLNFPVKVSFFSDSNITVVNNCHTCMFW